MDEDFLDVNEQSHHIAVIFILVVIVVAIGGYFLVFKKTYFSLKTVEVEVGNTLSENVDDYLKSRPGSIDDYKLDTSAVKTGEVGEYTFTITYKKSTKKGKVKVVDTTPPEFTTKELVIEEGNSDYYLGDLLETCTDASKPCLVSLKNSSDEDKYKEVGTHTLEIEVADLYGNKKSGEATLKVVAKGEYVDPRTKDLVYASNSKKIENFNGTIYKKLDKALNPEAEEARDEISRLSTIDLDRYVQENHTGYKLVSSEIIELYNKSSFVIGYSIVLTISNGKERTVYVDPNLAHEQISLDDEESKEE